MTSERWQRIEELFHQAMELPDEKRDAFLKSACDSDLGMRMEVESLLKADRDAGSFIEDSLERVSDLEAGEMIGPYEVLRRIGQGGMGTVYLAERADEEYRKRVALKIVRLGLQTSSMVARFRRERQILASLEHPNIAGLLDGGTTTSGMSYVVMEYIDGAPLNDYIRQHHLPVSERLALFEKICAAVHHAHLHLIVHRDIKPGNILVTTEGEPKLLDFGIATLLAPDGAGPLDPNQTLMRFITPRHASPEQVKGRTVTTASDIYSLGALLCEMLTASLPYRGLTGEALDRAICEEEPLLPSALIPDKNREYRKAVHGDLDTIILKAMRKEPERRYASVVHMAEDIRRHREGYPIDARSDRWSYRAGKFIRRHKSGVAAACTFGVLLAGFAISMTLLARNLEVQRDRASQERRKLEQVVDFIVNLFDVAGPELSRGATITVQQVLDDGAQNLEKRLAGEPEVRAKLMDTIGNVYVQLGLYDRAEPLLAKALALRSRLFGNDHRQTAASMESLGRLHLAKADYRRAEPLLRNALAVRQHLPGEEGAVAESLSDLGLFETRISNSAAGVNLLQQALRIQEGTGQEDRTTALILSNLGSALRMNGNLKDAGTIMQRAVDMDRRVLGDDHPQTADAMSRLGLLLQSDGRYAEAESILRQVLDLETKLVGRENSETAAAIANVAAVLFAEGKYAESEPLFREALDICRKTLGNNHPTTVLMMNNLATVRYSRDDLDGAEVLWRESLALNRKRFPNGHSQLADNLHNLGRLAHSRKNYPEAEALLKEALAMRIKVQGPEHPSVAITLDSLALVYRDEGDFRKAESLHLQALTIRRKKLQPGHPAIAVSLMGLGIARMNLGRLDEAEAAFREGLAIREKGLPVGHWEIAEMQSWLGECLTRLRRYDEAEPLLLDSYSVLRQKRGAQSAITNEAARRIVNLYEAWGRSDRATSFRAGLDRERE